MGLDDQLDMGPELSPKQKKLHPTRQGRFSHRLWHLEISYYIYGRRFVLVTDHKPLTTILSPKASLPALAAARIQRWAITFWRASQLLTLFSTCLSIPGHQTSIRAPYHPATNGEAEHYVQTCYKMCTVRPWYFVAETIIVFQFSIGALQMWQLECHLRNYHTAGIFHGGIIFVMERICKNYTHEDLPHMCMQGAGVHLHCVNNRSHK